MAERYDLAVVGAGICGLSAALAAARRGLRVVVVERDAQANGASVRNFGFVTVTGQRPGETWERARHSAETWREVAPKAGIPICHEGLLVTARRAEAVAVLEEFRASEMGERCLLLGPEETRRRAPALGAEPVLGGLWSPWEVRVEPRQAIPLLARHLADRYGVEFRFSTAVAAVAPPLIETGGGPIRAEAAVVCPGGDLVTLFGRELAAHQLRLCKLQMLRLAPQPSGWRLPGAVMSDLSLVRYEGYTACPASAALRRRLDREQPEWLAHGIHLIVVQSEDGSLVVGDSHHYAATPDPFAPADVEALIIEEARAMLSIPRPDVVERWIGLYPSSETRTAFIDAPDPRVRLLVVSSGTGMSTGFALGEEAVASLFGAAPRKGSAE